MGTSLICLDIYIFGVFPKSAKLREVSPMIAYGRTLLRLLGLAALLPLRATSMTPAGKSQLLAYLLHVRTVLIVDVK